MVSIGSKNVHADKNTPENVQKRMLGPRKNCQNTKVFVAARAGEPGKAKDVMAIVPHYRARPLDGVWATAPYLHNGAVPTLKDMLLPQDQRATKFCVGSREFDPVDVGLVVKAPKDDGKASKGEAGSATKERKDEDCASGLTTFDVTLQGNSNRGHSFEGVERDKKSLPAGVIGPGFSDGQRKALIEYLKTL